MWQAIVAGLQLLGLIFKWLVERDKDKREEKKALIGEVHSAFKEKDPKTRASRLNVAVGNINKLRK